MTKNLKTYYLLILDRSGSMECVRTATLSAINEQIGQIKELQLRYPEQSFFVSLITFNDTPITLLNLLPALELRQIHPQEYEPNGTTALYDAMGSGISTLRGQISSEINESKASAIVAVFTDGYENASREFNYQQIRQLIAELDTHPNWTFSYIGSTIDAMEIAVSLNIRHENAMHVSQKNLAFESRRNSERMEHYVNLKSAGHVSKDFLFKNKLGEDKHPEN